MRETVVLTEERAKMLRRKKEWIERIEKLSNCKISIEDQEAVIEGEDPLIILRVKEVFRALNRGFDLDSALYLLDENYFLEIIDVKEYGKTRERQLQLKGRVIGRKGSIKKMIEEKTNTKICIHGKTISIIGRWENLQVAKRAIEMLLEGKMHSSVQRFLEKNIVGY
ncbi:MAG: KH domain-containing protein [Candidatus Aenigmarchaeota archaeon]|jgi:ribosomal RNA assembly protein|nr:KH domain-containing protein [Candidatus Aenigmarchaeota archaeon]